MSDAAHPIDENEDTMCDAPSVMHPHDAPCVTHPV